MWCHPQLQRLAERSVLSFGVNVNNLTTCGTVATKRETLIANSENQCFWQAEVGVLRVFVGLFTMWTNRDRASEIWPDFVLCQFSVSLIQRHMVHLYTQNKPVTPDNSVVWVSQMVAWLDMH